MGTDDNIVTKGLHDEKRENNVKTNEEQGSCTDEEQGSCTDEELENEVININKEFNRKIELGRNLNIIMNESGFNENGLRNDMKDALNTYKLYGKNMDMKDIEWRGWQMDLRQYLDKPCDRKIIWVVGKEGYEGKSFCHPLHSISFISIFFPCNS